MAERFLSLKAVLALTSLSRSTVYRFMGLGQFPKSVKLGSRTAFIESEVAQWIDARIAERAA